MPRLLARLCLRLRRRGVRRAGPFLETFAQELEPPTDARHLSLVPDLGVYDPAEKTIRDLLESMGVGL